MKVSLLKDVDLKTLQPLIELEAEAFGTGGLNEWHLVPFIRHGRVYVASQEEKLVGLIEYMRDWENPCRAYLMGVSIVKEMRGKGYGTTLMRTSLQALQKENVLEVELTVDPKNLAAIKVYEGKLGFVAKGVRIDEYGSGENRLVMIASLANLVETQER